MVEAQQVENRGLQVVDVNRVAGINRKAPQLFRGANRLAGLYATTGHPHRESGEVMIATDLLLVGDLCN